MPRHVWDYTAAVAVIGQDILPLKLVHASPETRFHNCRRGEPLWASVKLKFAARPHALPKFFSWAISSGTFSKGFPLARQPRPHGPIPKSEPFGYLPEAEPFRFHL